MKDAEAHGIVAEGSDNILFCTICEGDESPPLSEELCGHDCSKSSSVARTGRNVVRAARRTENRGYRSHGDVRLFLGGMMWELFAPALQILSKSVTVTAKIAFFLVFQETKRWSIFWESRSELADINLERQSNF